jgi:hypothetical protein
MWKATQKENYLNKRTVIKAKRDATASTRGF